MALEPIKWRSKIILVKPEPLNAYGVDAVPTGAANAVLLKNVSFQPMEGQDVSRDLELAFMGGQESAAVGLYSVLTGDFELVGGGAVGVPPGWGALLRLCGVAEIITAGTSVEYVPVTDNHESGSVYFQVGPNRYVMLGGRATAVLTVSALGIPMVRITITGLFTIPAVAARPTVNLTAWQSPQVAAKANTPVFTIDGVTYALREFTLNLGCDVQPRMLVNQERIVIVDKAEQIGATIEAVPMNVYNPVQKAVSPAPRQEIVLTHGTILGKTVTVEAGQATQRRFTGGVDNQRIEEWPLTFNPLPLAGDDQWKITIT